MHGSKTRVAVPPWQWGIFYRKPCAGLLLDRRSPEYDSMNAIYQALKSSGYRETYWQFVYPGQVGGLIRNVRRTLIEHHIRFFDTGEIYAEMEIGRSASLHLINRRMYINSYIISRMNRRLPAVHLNYLRAAMKKAKITHPKDWTEWRTGNPFMTSNIKAKIRLLSALADWRTLALIMAASIVSTLTSGLAIVPLLTAIMIFVYLLAPKRA